MCVWHLPRGVSKEGQRKETQLGQRLTLSFTWQLEYVHQLQHLALWPMQQATRALSKSRSQGFLREDTCWADGIMKFQRKPLTRTNRATLEVGTRCKCYAGIWAAGTVCTRDANWLRKSMKGTTAEGGPSLSQRPFWIELMGRWRL